MIAPPEGLRDVLEQTRPGVIVQDEYPAAV
jgi:hypothetical protein